MSVLMIGNPQPEPDNGVYLVIARSGGIVNKFKSIAAAKSAEKRDRGHIWDWLVSKNPPRQMNPAGGPKKNHPQRALDAAGLRVVTQSEVTSLTLKDAWRKIKPYYDEFTDMPLSMEGTKMLRRTLAKVIDDSPDAGLLRENTKLAKTIPKKGQVGSISTASVGLAMLPEHTAFSGLSAGINPAYPGMGVNVSERTALPMAMDSRFEAPRPSYKIVNGKPVRPPTVSNYSTFCAYSSSECRSACLFTSGNMQSRELNNYLKLARSKSLVAEPAAFLRVLLQACYRFSISGHSKFGGCDKSVGRYVRLNILSDVPWEVMCRWLFVKTRFKCADQTLNLSGMSFYDYTKVPERKPEKRYYLCYSYSGSNIDFCRSEFKRGMNMVVAFAAPGIPKLPRERKGQINALRSNLLKERSAYGIPDDDTKEFKPFSGKGNSTNILKDELHSLGYDTVKQKFVIPLEIMQAFNRFVNPLPKQITVAGMNGGRPIPVVDGDASDIRPLDPKGVIVGLRFKHPGPGAFLGKSVKITLADLKSQETYKATLKNMKKITLDEVKELAAHFDAEYSVGAKREEIELAIVEKEGTQEEEKVVQEGVKRIRDYPEKFVVHGFKAEAEDGSVHYILPETPPLHIMDPEDHKKSPVLFKGIPYTQDERIGPPLDATSKTFMDDLIDKLVALGLRFEKETLDDIAREAAAELAKGKAKAAAKVEKKRIAAEVREEKKRYAAAARAVKAVERKRIAAEKRAAKKRKR